MKNKITRTLVLLGVFVSAGVANGQDNFIDIYMQPDVQSGRIDSVTLDDPRIGQAAPVMDDAKAALGWHYAQFEDIVEGYTPDGKIGKDLLPVDGAVIYSGPSSGSPVLGVFRYGSEIEVIDTGAWWKFRIKMQFPVYFVLDSPAPLPPVSAAADKPQVVVAPTPVAKPAPVVTQPAPMIEEMPIVDQPVRTTTTVSTSTITPRSQQQPSTTTPPDVIGQSYQGTFKLSKKTFGLFKPKEPFYLESAEGNRIAWVDTSDIVVPGSLKTFIDKAVIIHGERDYMESSKDWIIRARNMRMK
jgi:hypothetical protein